MLNVTGLNVTGLNVTGLIFDVENVLYDATSWQRWLLKLLSRIGLHTHYRSFFRVWESEFLDDVNRGSRDYWQAMRSFLTSAGLAPGQIDEVIAAGRTRYQQLQEPGFPLPEARETIARLAADGAVLGLLSNSPATAELILKRLQKLGFASSFRVALSSCELGCTMPQAEIYQSALSAMRLSASQVAFVGHSMVELSGAARLGMPTIAVNYDSDVRADIHLDRFSDLLSAVTLPVSRLLAG